MSDSPILVSRSILSEPGFPALLSVLAIRVCEVLFLCGPMLFGLAQLVEVEETDMGDVAQGQEMVDFGSKYQGDDATQ